MSPQYHLKYDKDVYINDMLEDGVQPLLIILDSIVTDCRYEAEQLEIAYIQAYRDRGYLITGGEGYDGGWDNHTFQSFVDVHLAQLDVVAMLRDMYGTPLANT